MDRMQCREWIYSNRSEKWIRKAAEQDVQHERGQDAFLTLDGTAWQRMAGFGACFNEVGYRALNALSAEAQERVLRDLFSDEADACGFRVCRLPIGANDYAEGWYSLDEIPGDYVLKHFSIERDRQCLIPYIRSALRYAPELQLFASPWSPPTWMKEPPVYNWGKLIWEERNLCAYADYFVKFLRAYEQEGVHIAQVHVQNEPVANQKFPSCMWTGEELRDFIRDYLGPALRAEGLDTELWLGTINAPGCDYNKMIFDKWQYEDYDYFAGTVLNDPEACKYIAGVSYQWGGKIAIGRTFESWWPQIRLMQSENESGFGDNTWDYAKYNWTMLRHYITNGAESYVYWNMILPKGGVSTWGDPQNSMITVEEGLPIYHPDYYVMKHFSHLVKPGSVRKGMRGSWSADSLVFEQPDGSLVLEVFNPFRRTVGLVFEANGERLRFELEPESVNSMRITF